MKFNLRAITFLLSSNLSYAKSVTGNVVVRVTRSPPPTPVPVRGSRESSGAGIQNVETVITVYTEGMQNIGADVYTYTLQGDDDAILSNPDMIVETDKRLESMGMKIASTETTPWGIEEVLEDVTFWDNLGTPSGEVKVCVVGSGYALGHEDLPSEYVIGTDSSFTSEGWNKDVIGVGTHSAGIVAAIGNDKGVKGIIPNNKGGKFTLVIGKSTWGEDGSGSLSSEIEAVTSCKNQGAKVIIVTMGSTCYSQIEADFYQGIHDNGILVFAAGGNSGDESYTYPASLPSVVSVASSRADKSWDGSGMNDQVELTAPGETYSTKPSNKYGVMGGTAMSAAHAGAVAGLLWMYHPTCTHYQIRAALASTAMDLGKTGCDDKFGFGLVQAKAAHTLLTQNCGGAIGETKAVGGCHQLTSPVLEGACSSDSDCDDGDECTVDTCKLGMCSYDHDCAACSLSKLVTVDILTDDFPQETTWEILDYSTYERVMAKDTTAYGNCKRKYSKSQCLADGGYLFVIYDSENDGISGKYGRGRYEVSVAGERKVFGGEFKSTKSHFFSVSDATFAPTTTLAPIGAPTGSGTDFPTNNPTSTVAPIPITCSSYADCDDGDDCTDDSCVASKCKFVTNCASCGLPHEITVDVLTDYSPEETSWEIKKYKSNEVIARSPSYSSMAYSYSSSKCVKNGIYVFAIYDSANDGICCSNWQGSYSVSVDGSSKATGGEFKSVEMHLLPIGVDVRTSNPRNQIPTWAPTSSENPTYNPTATHLPTDMPSDVPSFLPSDVPSDIPSFVPSTSPSDRCAKDTEESLSCGAVATGNEIAPFCCGSLECFATRCVPQCGKEGEGAVYCDSSLGPLHPKKVCCPGFTCGNDKKCHKELEQCAPIGTIAKECKKASSYSPDFCCSGLKCGGTLDNYCMPFCAKRFEEAKSCTNNPDDKSPLVCCQGFVCNDRGKCDYPDTCARSGVKSQCCGANNAEFKDCCDGLVCNENKECVEPGFCAKNTNSKQCGATYAEFETCCAGYVCEEKKCVPVSDTNQCGVAGALVLECGLCPSDLPAKDFTDLKKVCCKDYVCIRDHTMLDRPNCIKEIAPNGKPAINCGDTNAKFLKCDVGSECNPFPSSVDCIKQTADAQEKERAKECGWPWSKNNHCAEGLVCDFDKTAATFMLCVKPEDTSNSKYDETTFCATEGQNAKQCTDARFAPLDTCCPGLVCEKGETSKKCVTLSS